MKFLSIMAAITVLWACTSTPEIKPIQKDLGVIPNVGGAVMSRLAPAPVDEVGIAYGSYQIHNRYSKDRIQWSRVSVPFQKGAVKNVSELKRYNPGHGVYDWKVLKWWGDAESIAIAQLITPAFLKAGESKTFKVFKGGEHKNLWPFKLGSHLFSYLKSQDMESAMYAEVVLSDDTVVRAPFFKHPKILSFGDHHLQARWRSQFFKNDGSKHPLGFTAYMDIYNMQDFGEMVIQVGNDDWKNPVNGGVSVKSISLYVKRPFEFNIRNQAAYQTQTTWTNLANGYRKITLVGVENIADATQRTFRGVWGFENLPNGLLKDSQVAELNDPLFGMSEESTWANSKAGGIWGAVLPKRASRQKLFQSVEHLCNSPEIVSKNSPTSLRYLSKTPGMTGDQPQFSGNMPLPQQQSIVTSSSCPVQDYLHGLTPISFRSSYWFHSNDRMKIGDIPSSCVFWDSYPHWHPSWNSGHCDEANVRAGNNGWNKGNTYNWKTEDQQHHGERHLAAAWELSGDAFLGDLLVYRQALAVWAKLGDFQQYFERWGSERSVRVQEDATQAYLYFPRSPNAAKLMERLKARVDVHYRQNQTAMGLNSYGFAAWEYVHNDGRHPECMGSTPGATNVRGGLFEDNGCIVGWWTGFHLGWLGTMYRHGFETDKTKTITHNYMAARAYYFYSTGRNSSEKRVNNWTYPLGGSFTQSWYSGWVPAVELMGEGGPEFNWFKDVMIPFHRANAYPINRPGDVWTGHDKWWI